MQIYADTMLNCRDCHRRFVFTAGEQESHDSKSFMNAPSRCPACRAARKVERDRYEARANEGRAAGRSDAGGRGGPGGQRWPRPRR